MNWLKIVTRRTDKKPPKNVNKKRKHKREYFKYKVSDKDLDPENPDEYETMLIIRVHEVFPKTDLPIKILAEDDVYKAYQDFCKLKKNFPVGITRWVDTYSHEFLSEEWCRRAFVQYYTQNDRCISIGMLYMKYKEKNGCIHRYGSIENAIKAGYFNRNIVGTWSALTTVI